MVLSDSFLLTYISLASLLLPGADTTLGCWGSDSDRNSTLSLYSTRHVDRNTFNWGSAVSFIAFASVSANINFIRTINFIAIDDGAVESTDAIGLDAIGAPMGGDDSAPLQIIRLEERVGGARTPNGIYSIPKQSESRENAKNYKAVYRVE